MKHKIYSLDILSRKEQPFLSENELSDNEHQLEKVKQYLFQITDEILTNRQKQILFRVISGEKQREIAEDLGISKSTVSRTYHRGVKNLKEHTKYLEQFLR